LKQAISNDDEKIMFAMQEREERKFEAFVEVEERARVGEEFSKEPSEGEGEEEGREEEEEEEGREEEEEERREED
jgi:hypothetical protein